jgi:hypothetical protein
LVLLLRYFYGNVCVHVYSIERRTSMQAKHLLSGLVSATLAVGMTSNAIAASKADAPATASASSAYNQPPKEILDVMRAPPPPSPSLSPTRDKLMLVTMDEYPSIAKVATPFLRLAGVRIEPGNHSQHDTPGGYGIPPCVSAIDLVQVADGKQLAGETAGRRLPAAPRVERRRPALRLREHHCRYRSNCGWATPGPAPCAACPACA